MFTEVVFPVNQLKDGFIVDVVKCDMDMLIVEYKDAKYALKWWDQHHYYRGMVGDIECYV